MASSDYTNYWLDQIDKRGLADVENELPTLSKNLQTACRQAIEIYLRKQRDEADSRQEKREEKTLRIAEGANHIARRAQWIAIGAIVFSVLIAVFKNGG